MELVAKTVEEAIDNKDPPIVEVGPTRKAGISLNHTKFKDEIPPLSDNDMDEEMKESTNEEQNPGHAEDLIKLSASSPLSSQAKETSDKSPQTDIKSVKVKRFKRKKEHIRLGALLPDDIRLSNHMTCSRMSTKEYNSHWKYLRKKCKDTMDYNDHTSLNNLGKISKNL